MTTTTILSLRLVNRVCIKNHRSQLLFVWRSRRDYRLKHLPLFLNVDQKPCVVVGGGRIACRKTKSLLAAGAKVTIVSPQIKPYIQQQTSAGRLTHINASYPSNEFSKELANATLVLACTNSIETNAAIAADAKKAKVLSNIADNPSAGDFLLPSIVDRDPLTIAISSGGASPIMTRLIKQRIEAFIPQGMASLAQLAGEYRQAVRQKLTKLPAQRRFWENVFDGEVSKKAINGDMEAARSALQNTLDTHDIDSHSAGEVYLVGAGPGDPDLLTFRALRLIQQADVVLYDRLVSEPILNMCRDDAERIYVGKKRANHAMQQSSINDTLVSFAQSGKRVLRLKGGDPFIFGRGGEEIETLAEHGVRFQIVPGITAASGCASYAGIPLTHRDHAQSCVFVTGHLKQGELELPWRSLVLSSQTIVCYMGLVGLPTLSRKLIEHGLDKKTPAALIERGTTVNQNVITGTIESIPQLVQSQDVKAPTLIIIGSVVSLHSKLAWFG